MNLPRIKVFVEGETFGSILEGLLHREDKIRSSTMTWVSFLRLYAKNRYVEFLAAVHM